MEAIKPQSSRRSSYGRAVPDIGRRHGGRVTLFTKAGLFGVPQSRMSQYRSAWQRLGTFMNDRGDVNYSAMCGEAFIYHLIGSRKFENLDRWEQDIIYCTNVLTEFLETGMIKFRRGQKFYDLWGAVGQTMQAYIAEKKAFGLSSGTLTAYHKDLQHFLAYLDTHDIADVHAITATVVISYTATLGFCTPHIRHRRLSIVKGFLRYLYDRGLAAEDGSPLVPRDQYSKQPVLPSTYTRDEIAALIAAIDRSSPKGKRDYAMVLITARLGLRATDVCDLGFENLRWEDSVIILNQRKTGERIELPLLADVGAALIDYLKYGRPVSELPFIFLHVNPPYDRLNRTTLHSIVSLYLRRAGIVFEKERRHGPHALRHSLAGVLLAKKTPVPVIAAVLGHRSTESARFYLRIDLQALRQCALKVPAVPPAFYVGRSPR
ncbi:phage integrase family protein [Sulfobacillus acidophilus TPY]|nr:phage integrase family protein [Sulfobacillus acidophilus TPY]